MVQLGGKSVCLDVLGLYPESCGQLAVCECQDFTDWGPTPKGRGLPTYGLVQGSRRSKAGSLTLLTTAQLINLFTVG